MATGCNCCLAPQSLNSSTWTYVTSGYPITAYRLARRKQKHMQMKMSICRSDGVLQR